MTAEDAALPPGWRLATSARSKMPPGWSTKGFTDDLFWPGDDVLASAETAVLPPGCEDSVWILHNQYVCPAGVDPGSLAWEEIPDIYTVAPPVEFIRFRWSEVARIKGVPLRGAFWDGLEVPPCFRWEAFLGWDEAALVLPGASFVYQPKDATIGQIELEELLPVLQAATTSYRLEAVFSAVGRAEDDIAGQVIGADGYMHRRVFYFNTGDLLPALLRRDPPYETPEFWWPEDRSWLVWTDWDLLGSKVFGSKELIEALRRHPELEALDWFPTRTTS
ncbi:hypothetical protein [Paenarthrobacter sp. A20]|uniref:hypothetical protein n=1 Tax=Paenarthrobacter sp. A20 TaxID=2817891 RepID=UPI00209EEF85|nr:hypothetical protein [Paenarthrobacter sp. A20]MCP1413673.1 hypothetical protein [Paenarthrobacter sp. A20]